MAKLPTLTEFIASYEPGYNKRSYVRERGFSSLYVRIGPRYLGGVLVARVLDLAAAEVPEYRRGKGLLTKLLQRLRTKYPDLTLYLENVQTERLAYFYRRLGFKEISPRGELPCFTWRP